MSRLFAFGLAAFIVSLVGVSSLSAQQDIYALAASESVQKELAVTDQQLRRQEVTGGYRQKVDQIQQDYQAELGKIIKESHLKRLEQINLQKDWRSLRRVGATGH